MDNASIFGFALDAVRLGFLGFGALLFVLVFLILIRNQPAADAGTTQLRHRFLTWGVMSFVFAGLASLIEPFVNQPTGTHRLSVTFSPNFSAANLPEPSMVLLPDQTPIGQNEPFSIREDGTVKVSIDQIIAHARGLSETAENLVAANETLTKRLMESGATLEVPDGASAISPEDLSRLRETQNQLKEDIQSGNTPEILNGSATIKGTLAR